MSKDTYPAVLQAMIDRAGSLTPAETKALGDLWESNEDLVLPEPSFASELLGGLDFPVVTNATLVSAWETAVHVAGDAGRANELDAARTAGRAATRDVRFDGDSEAEKNGTEQAVRSAVLAVGVIDLISKSDYLTLVTPWQHILGTTLVEHDK
jgi:hypothetical protein